MSASATPVTNAPAVKHEAKAQETHRTEKVTIEVAGHMITVPRRFYAGDVLNESEAKVIDAAFQRQYINNQNAMDKARKDKLSAAKTSEERKIAQRAIDEMTPAKLVENYITYVPNVGGPRMSASERNELDAGWAAWVRLVAEHNAAKEKGIIAKAKGKHVALPTSASKVLDGDGKPVLDENGKPKTISLADQRDTIARALLQRPAFADRIKAELDRIMAEKGKVKAEAPAEETVASGDLF